MNELVEVVNRMRAQGWAYDKIEAKLVKMGNSAENASDAVEEYKRRVLA